jgi:hypothetical protein
MTPTSKDISKWASDSYRDLTISEVVSEPRIQRWAWDFFNKPEDRLIEIGLEIDGEDVGEVKWLLLNPGKTPTRCFLDRINEDVQKLLPLARVTSAETYCGQYASYKRWLKAKGFFSKINEPVAPEPPKTKPLPSADDKHNWLTNDVFFGEIRRKHGEKEILPTRGHLLGLGLHVPSLKENFQPYWIYLGNWPSDIVEAIRPDVEEIIGEPVDIQIRYRQGLHSRKPLLRWLVAKGFYTDDEADERGRQEALEIVNELEKNGVE